ncbi:hypothetical protein KUV51_09410 [Tateyamaria omphalii]|uniref:hypothetical protein n=1 Tax=Tateyamaria omphalii TaxID=299262 RepID=UPI001C99BC18|nr:hypothetical protein [Tateyamaria omphalii]MBY5933212.1 hypothetical protein [Tateyamaria omphalii]
MNHETKSPTAEARANTAPQDISTWLKKPLTISAPTWAFLAAGLVALALFGLALD